MIEDDANHKSFSITAVYTDITNDVKTSYDDSEINPSFSWLSTDRIAVQLESRASAGSYDQWQFISEGTGATTTFTADESQYTLDILSTWKLGTYALYPKHAADASSHRDLLYAPAYDDVYLQPESVVTKDELTSLVPLIGIRDDSTGEDSKTSVVYNFKTATGVIRISLKNTPATAKKVKVTANSASAYLSGYILTSSLADSEISSSDIYYDKGNTKTIVFGFTPTEGEDLVIYIPIPTGTLAGGFTISLLGDDDAEIISKSTSEDVVITRNSIINIPDITLDSGWKSIGSGWFGDNYLFSQSNFNKIGSMAVVDIQQSTSNPNQYRIRDPYAAAARQLGVSLGGFHNAYFTFTVDGENVTYSNHKTGIQFDNGTTYINCNTMLFQDGSSYDKVYYDSTYPKLVTLSPNYKMESSTGNKDYSVTLSGSRKNCTNIINIVFPGYGIGEAVSGVWTINSSENTFTISAIDDGNYNVAITHYHDVGKSYDFNGICKGTYDPNTGKITFPANQVFYTNGDGQSWSFRGFNGTTWATEDFVIIGGNNDGEASKGNDYFTLDKFDSASGNYTYDAYYSNGKFKRNY